MAARAALRVVCPANPLTPTAYAIVAVAALALVVLLCTSSVGCERPGLALATGGLHMSMHVGAMLIAALANAYARKSKANPLSLRRAKAQTSAAPLM